MDRNRCDPAPFLARHWIAWRALARQFFVGRVLARSVLVMGIAWVFLGSGPGAHADVYVPDGLNAGDKYHLAFISSGVSDAPSSDSIDFFNDFIQSEAELNPELTGTVDGVPWKVIGSSLTLDAKDNAPISAPVYLFDGTKVADDESDMWDGTIDNPINVDQFGNPLEDTEAYTGTLPDGTKWFVDDTRYYLGSLFPQFGLNDRTDSAWVDYDQDFNFVERHFYGLSGELSVSSAVPEPNALALVAGALAPYLLTRRRKSRSMPLDRGAPSPSYPR